MSHGRDNWDTQLEFGLPDARLSGVDRERKVVWRGRMPWERIWCVSCAEDGGLVTADFAAHVFYICEPCAKRYGPVPGLDPIPEAVVESHRPQ